jgi:hypothetical protein
MIINIIIILPAVLQWYVLMSILSLLMFNEIEHYLMHLLVVELLGCFMCELLAFCSSFFQVTFSLTDLELLHILYNSPLLFKCATHFHFCSEAWCHCLFTVP